jgi:glycosyltransferase involved in cell wall biosynthesis
MMTKTFSRVVVISDYQAGPFDDHHQVPAVEWFRNKWQPVEQQPCQCENLNFRVEGSYLERLPLACIKSGLVEEAEIWTHWRGAEPPPEAFDKMSPLRRRAFCMNGFEAPFNSNDMIGHIQTRGAPELLCVWGLGVSEGVMAACSSSFKIYNSIDAPSLRVPFEVGRHFDLIITGAQWQSEEVRQVYPDMATIVLPIGPEFASPTMFRPLPSGKMYDVIYVAAAQPYKRHDILLGALAKYPRKLKALCVCGYGETVGESRAQAAKLGVEVKFIEPPGVPYSDINKLINQSRLGVVCGIDDGAPAILTEYMLAGIPVLANVELKCGLQYIEPKTGIKRTAEDFHTGFADILENIDRFSPRKTVLQKWVWQRSVEKLRKAILSTSKGRHIFGGKELTI